MNNNSLSYADFETLPLPFIKMVDVVKVVNKYFAPNASKKFKRGVDLMFSTMYVYLCRRHLSDRYTPKNVIDSLSKSPGNYYHYLKKHNEHLTKEFYSNTLVECEMILIKLNDKRMKERNNKLNELQLSND